MNLRPFALVLLVLSGCTREPAGGEPAGAADDLASDSARNFQGRAYERNIVFLTPRADSGLLVGWLLTARTLPGGVRREARGFLARGESWEPFLAEAWETPPTRVPWRILPRGRMRVIVGDHEALERLAFEEGPRQLEVVLDSSLVEWSGPLGESFRLLEGALVLSSTRIPGLVLDMTRARRARDPLGGDWGILASGDSLQLVLHAPRAEPTAGFRAWARVGSAELQWPEVTVAWSETRSFERARRDIPVAWWAVSADGDMEARFAVRTAQLEAGPGEGPLLPVDALFEVDGEVRIGEATYPVRGLLRHVQP